MISGNSFSPDSKKWVFAGVEEQYVSSVLYFSDGRKIPIGWLLNFYWLSEDWVCEYQQSVEEEKYCGYILWGSGEKYGDECFKLSVVKNEVKWYSVEKDTVILNSIIR